MASTTDGATSTALALGCALWATATARAEIVSDYPPFRYDTERPGVLVLDGEIDVLAGSRFDRALTRFQGIETVELSSPGGSAIVALGVAHRIRDKGLATAIPAGAECLSACAYLFFAGVARTAEGRLGVHNVAGTGNAASTQELLGEVFAAFEAFGVPAAVHTRMMTTPAEEMPPPAPPTRSRWGRCVRPGRPTPRRRHWKRRPRPAPAPHAGHAGACGRRGRRHRPRGRAAAPCTGPTCAPREARRQRRSPLDRGCGRGATGGRATPGRDTDRGVPPGGTGEAPLGKDPSTQEGSARARRSSGKAPRPTR